MIKLLFLTHSLGGGAERVLVNLVNHMDRSRFDITVRTLFSDGVNRKMLDMGIRYECCHAGKGSRTSGFERIQELENRCA